MGGEKWELLVRIACDEAGCLLHMFFGSFQQKTEGTTNQTHFRRGGPPSLQWDVFSVPKMDLAWQLVPVS